MRRIIVAAALGATCWSAAVAAAEWVRWENADVGVSCEVPAGYEVRLAEAEDNVPARTARLEWEDGPYSGLRVLFVAREGRYDNPLIAAGLFQRRVGASAAFEAEAGALSAEELAAAGANDGVRAAYTLAEVEGASRLEVMFLDDGNKRYRAEVSFPAALEAQLGAAAERVLETLKITPAKEAAVEDAAEAGGAEEEAPSE